MKPLLAAIERIKGAAGQLGDALDTLSARRTLQAA